MTGTSRTSDWTGTMKGMLHDSLDGLSVNGEVLPHFEKVRSNVPMPYLINGRVSMSDRQATPGNGYLGSQNFEIQMDAFSDYNGDKEVDAIRDAVIGVLMDSMTAPDGYTIVNRELDNSFTIYEDNSAIRHGVVEVQIALQKLVTP